MVRIAGMCSGLGKVGFAALLNDLMRRYGSRTNSVA